MTTNDTPAKAPPALAAGAELELGFNDLLANGQAVGRSAGMVVFCFGPLPGERARVRVTAVKPKYAVGELIEITLRSPQRATPFCPVFGTCGGCQLQHLSYAGQLAWKQRVVEGALTRIGGFDGVAVRPAIGMINPRNYRNKMSLVTQDGPAGLHVGFYKQRSHDVVAIDACPIVAPPLSAQIPYLNNVLQAPDTQDAVCDARHIVSRTSRASEQTVVTFTTAHPASKMHAIAPALMRRLPGTAGITNSFALSSENAIMGRRQYVAAGTAQIEEEIEGVRYRVSPASFFQVNVEIVARIFAFMSHGLSTPRSIVDLYCGAGTFSLFFAKNGAHVVGIEENAQAVSEANENAALNDLADRVEFHRGRVEDLIRHGSVRKAMQEAQIVFLDPPRKGSDEATLSAVAQSGVPNIWYLSCDPATLARDSKFLAAKGYRLGVVQPFDMFPQTGHVETLVTMYRQSALEEHIIAEAFAQAPAPQWPKHYPDFVIQEDER